MIVSNHLTLLLFTISLIFFIIPKRITSDKLLKENYPPYDSWNPRWFYENNTLNYDTYNYNNDNLIILVSTAPYHVEILAFLAYHYHTLGYTVHAWIGAPTKYYGSWIDFLFPYIEHVVYLPDYGIVHWYNTRWRTKPTIPLSIKLLIYVTGDLKVDIYSLCQLNYHQQLYQRSQRVLMVSHQASLIQNASLYCQAPKCTLLHLGYHVQQTAISIYTSLPKQESFPVHTSYAYPVFELPSETIPSMNNSDGTLTTTSRQMFNQVRRIIIQGAANKTRRDYDELFRCVRKITLLNKLNNKLNKQQLPQQQQTRPRIEISIIGYLAKQLNIPPELKNRIKLYDNIPYEKYYTLLQSNDFIATFIQQTSLSNFGYLYNRISSSIPAGVLAEVPIIATSDLLERYHCLNASYWHHFIARPNNCKSLMAAMEMTYEQYERMKEEIRYCKSIWLYEGQATLKHIVEGNRISVKDDNHFQPTCPKEYNR